MKATERPLEGKVAVVTGASRGIGKGIALELGAAGATVYATGRSAGGSRSGSGPGSVDETAEEISRLGGTGIGVRCDHSEDTDVEALFKRIADEEGKLHVLANNVYNSPASMRFLGKPFWEVPAAGWDETFIIGVRSHYVASVLAAPLLFSTGDGLIVNISSTGAVRYSANVVYGVGKAAVDRMTSDMAYELADRSVAVVSVWPGIVNTEFLQTIPAGPDGRRVLPLPGGGEYDLSLAESVHFTGRGVVALAADTKRREWSGKAVPIADLADHYGFTDIDGRVPTSSAL